MRNKKAKQDQNKILKPDSYWALPYEVAFNYFQTHSVDTQEDARAAFNNDNADLRFKYSPYFSRNYIDPSQPGQQLDSCVAWGFIRLSGSYVNDFELADWEIKIVTDDPDWEHQAYWPGYTWHHVFMGYKTNPYDRISDDITYQFAQPINGQAYAIRNSREWYDPNSPNAWNPIPTGDHPIDIQPVAFMQLVPTTLHESTAWHSGSKTQWKYYGGGGYGGRDRKPSLKTSKRLSEQSNYSENDITKFEEKVIKLPKLAKEIYSGKISIKDLEFKYKDENNQTLSSYECGEFEVEHIFPLKINGDTESALTELSYLTQGDFNPSVERSIFMHKPGTYGYIEPPSSEAIPFGYDSFGELLYIGDNSIWRCNHEFGNFNRFIVK